MRDGNTERSTACVNEQEECQTHYSSLLTHCVIQILVEFDIVSL